MKKQLKQGKVKVIYYMSKKEYLKDKRLYLIIGMTIYLVILLVLLAFKVNIEATLAITFTYFIGLITILIADYIRKKTFYNNFKCKLDSLDQKYLIVEMLQDAHFLEGRILTDALYEIDKSMIEKINEYKMQVKDFKEYVELWIHEVKLPVASLTLMVHNQKGEQSKKLLSQLTRLDNYLEQILYYVRSENAEKDYLITKVNLSKVISNVALKNKDILLAKGIDFVVSDVDIEVLTDSKWLEFIINQIVDNSIKYSKEKNAYIKIVAKDENKVIRLIIYDNGKGISKSDLPRVFDKTFTGTNGRGESAKSTGMGLYLCRELCNKLGHKIQIISEEGKYTKITILFDKNTFFHIDKE